MFAAKTPRGPRLAGDRGGGDEQKVTQLTRTIKQYKEVVRNQARRILAFERKIDEQKEIIEGLQSQKELIFDNFCTLRHKYNGVKDHLCEILWGVLPSGYIPGVEGQESERLEGIPPLKQDIVESPKQIGNYDIGDVLGEGQFASVRAIRLRPGIDIGQSCEVNYGLEKVQEIASQQETSTIRSGPERAVKIINKADVVSLTTLRRVDNEIAVLRLLRHEGVMQLHEVIHAPVCLYMVTDKAGRDLFDFFDQHLEGLPESVASLLMHKIIEPLHYCHSMGIVHRDLKPENVLFADSGNVLKEFCGSPGFFAPEMLTEGVYEGRKADVWSLGCILLELVLGHEAFCRLWMVAYDTDQLKDSRAFKNLIKQAVADLKEELPVCLSPALCRFLLETLDLDSNKRPTSGALLQHDWMIEQGYATAAPEQVMSDDNDKDLPPPPSGKSKQRKRGNLKIAISDGHPDTVDPEQVHVSLSGPRDGSPLQPVGPSVTSTTLKSNEMEGKGDGKELVSQREDSIDSDSTDRYEEGGGSSLEDQAVNAPSAAQLEPCGDRKGRVLGARQRRIVTMPETPTIRGTRKEMSLPAAGPISHDVYLEDARSNHSTPGVSPRESPAIKVPSIFFAHEATTSTSVAYSREERRLHTSTLEEVDSEDSSLESDNHSSTGAVHLSTDGKDENDLTKQEGPGV